MSKYDYFSALESLCSLSVRAIEMSCSRSCRPSESPSALRRASDKIVCELEDTLFSDFLPPLERDSIAACAHSLSRVADEALELIPSPSDPPFKNEEGLLCLRLAESLFRTVSMLKRITKPNELPETEAFRHLLREGRDAHGNMLSALRTGTIPRSAAPAIIQTGRLRAELSEAFDRVVEVMLGNI